MSQLLLDNSIGEIDQLEFDLLNLNFTILTRIRNDTINLSSTTEAFTSHAAIQWRGSFMLMVEDQLMTVIEHLNSMAHPTTHSASIIDETIDRLWMTSAEKIKLSNIAPRANNYTHPTEHALSEITDSATRIKFTMDEHNKLINIDDEANKYVHPTEHTLDEIDGLIGGDGFLIPQPPPIIYNDKNRAFFEEINLSFAGFNIVKDDVNYADMVVYTGQGVFTQPEIPFGSGFNTNLSREAMFLIGNDTDTESVNIFTTHAKFSLKTDTPHETFPTSEDNVGIFGRDWLTIHDDIVHLGTWTDTVAIDKINKPNSLYSVLGFRTTTPTEAAVAGGVKMFIENNAPIRGGLDDNGKTVSFIRYMADGKGVTYIVRPIGDRFYTYIAGTNTFLPNVARLYTNTYVYFENTYKLSPIVFLVDYGTIGNTHSFRVSYMHNWQPGFTTMAGWSFTKATIDDADEIIKTIKIETRITAATTSYVDPDQSILVMTVLTSSSAYNLSRIRVYTINTTTGTMSYTQTISLNHYLHSIDLISHRMLMNTMDFPATYRWTNFIVFYHDGFLYFYMRPADGGSFALHQTVPYVNSGHVLPGLHVRQIESCCLSPESTTQPLICIIMRTESYLHFIQFDIFYGFLTTVIGYNANILSNWLAVYDTPETIGQCVQYNTFNNFYLYKLIKHILIPNKYNGDCDICNFNQVADGTNVSIRKIQKIKTNGYTNGTIVRCSDVWLNINKTTSINKYYKADEIAGLHAPSEYKDIDYLYETFPMNTNPEIGFWMFSHICRPETNYSQPPFNLKPYLIFGYRFTSNDSMEFCVKYVAVGSDTAIRYSIKCDTVTTAGSGINFPLRVSQSELMGSILYIFNHVVSDLSIPMISSNSGEHFTYFGFSGSDYQLTSSLSTRTVGGIAGKTAIFELLPGESIDLGFDPNIVMFRYLNEEDYLNVTSVTIGFDKYIRLGQSTQRIDRPVVVTGTSLSVSGDHPMWVLAIAAETHPESESIVFTPPTTSPLCILPYGFDATGEKAWVVGNDEVYVNGNVLVTGPTVINNPLTLQNPDTRYIYATKTKELIYNDNPVGTMQVNSTPEERGYPQPSSILPAACVTFEDGVITDVVKYPSGDSYETEWTPFAIGNVLNIPNRFMMSYVFVSVYIKNVEDGFTDGELNQITTFDDVVVSGVKVSVTDKFITISSFPGQAYLIAAQINAEIKVIVKRMF